MCAFSSYTYSYKPYTIPCLYSSKHPSKDFKIKFLLTLDENVVNLCMFLIYKLFYSHMQHIYTR
ncbi:hypothetical protein HanPSC8_Chr06g0231971 [Helianthus annuus]|nr:hypothetical protein HanPSC8_Chr06g0231971 [Helianthus annuus]